MDILLSAFKIIGVTKNAHTFIKPKPCPTKVPLNLYLLLFALNMMSITLYAADFEFKSKSDRFNITVNDTGALFEGQPVTTEPFRFIHPLFQAEMTEDCPPLQEKPDLVITRKIEGKVESREVFIEKEILRDKKKCRLLTGHGLYKLPLHRDWFLNQRNSHIDLGANFTIQKSGRTVVAFKREGDEWLNTDPAFFTNWTFFNQFRTTIEDFPVTFRVHKAAIHEKNNFELVQGTKIYGFYKIGEKTWAVLMPGASWLEASGAFGFFDEMEPRIWMSPDSKLLRIVSDKSAKPNLRIKAIRNLASSFGSDAKPVFMNVLKTDGDSHEVRREIVATLRKQPSDSNFKLLIEALNTTQERGVQTLITDALRVRNPKGPVVDESDNDSVAKKKCETWTDWARSNLTAK